MVINAPHRYLLLLLTKGARQPGWQGAVRRVVGQGVQRALVVSLQPRRPSLFITASYVPQLFSSAPPLRTGLETASGPLNGMILQQSPVEERVRIGGRSSSRCDARRAQSPVALSRRLDDHHGHHRSCDEFGSSH